MGECRLKGARLAAKMPIFREGLLVGVGSLRPIAPGDSLSPLGGRARDRHRRDQLRPRQSRLTTKAARGNGQAETLASSSLGSRST
jgi:hypothetical protein